MASAETEESSLAREERQELASLHSLEGELSLLRSQLASEEARLALARDERGEALAQLEVAGRERRSLDRRLTSLRRREERRHACSRLLKLQLAVATQLAGAAEQLSQLPPSGALSPQRGELSEALFEREREVEELQRSLKRQQGLVDDAHRQLLELATRRKPLGAASSHAKADALRAALGEQEIARMRAEARADELQAQVQMLEEQGLRLRLHQPPPISQHERQKPVRVLLPSLSQDV